MRRRDLNTENARRLRRDMTPPERVLWNRLKNRQLGGLKFRRQQPIGGYVADFYCAEAKLVVELDSDMHDRTHDERRDAWMRREGIETFRVQARELAANEEGVLNTMLRVALGRVGERES